MEKIGLLIYSTFGHTEREPSTNKKVKGSGCGSVGRVVAFDTRGPRFDSSHWQNLMNICLLTCLLSTVLKRRK